MRTLAVFLSLLLLPLTARAGDAFGWRRDGSGTFPGATPPTHWDSKKNVGWSTPLAGPNNASPVLVGHLLFVCEEPTTLVCLDARNGHVLWKRNVSLVDALPPAEAAQGREVQARGEAAAKELVTQRDALGALKRKARWTPSPELAASLTALESRVATLASQVAEGTRFNTPPTGNIIGYASSTPVTDGHAIYEVFGNGVAVAYDLAGHRLWIKDLGAPPQAMNGFDRGHSASPLSVGGKLIVPFGALQALDPQDGHVLWRGATYQDFGTPAAARIGDVDTIITPNGDVVRVDDGRVLAHGLGALRYTGPVVSDGVAYFAGSWNPPQGLGDSVEARIRAVRLSPKLLEGAPPEILFDNRLPEVRYYSSGVVRDGLFYVVSDTGRVTVSDVSTGDVVWDRRITPHEELKFFQSVTSAGKYLFIGGSLDTFTQTWVLEPGRTVKLVDRNGLDGFTATPVFSGRDMFVRGAHGVYRVSMKPGSPPPRPSKDFAESEQKSALLAIHHSAEEALQDCCSVETSPKPASARPKDWVGILQQGSGGPDGAHSGEHGHDGQGGPANTPTTGPGTGATPPPVPGGAL